MRVAGVMVGIKFKGTWGFDDSRSNGDLFKTGTGNVWKGHTISEPDTLSEPVLNAKRKLGDLDLSTDDEPAAKKSKTEGGEAADAPMETGEDRHHQIWRYKPSAEGGGLWRYRSPAQLEREAEQEREAEEARRAEEAALAEAERIAEENRQARIQEKVAALELRRQKREEAKEKAKRRRQEKGLAETTQKQPKWKRGWTEGTRKSSRIKKPEGPVVARKQTHESQTHEAATNAEEKVMSAAEIFAKLEAKANAEEAAAIIEEPTMNAEDAVTTPNAEEAHAHVEEATTNAEDAVMNAEEVVANTEEPITNVEETITNVDDTIMNAEQAVTNAEETTVHVEATVTNAQDGVINADMNAEDIVMDTEEAGTEEQHTEEQQNTEEAPAEGEDDRLRRYAEKYDDRTNQREERALLKESVEASEENLRADVVEEPKTSQRMEIEAQLECPTQSG